MEENYSKLNMGIFNKAAKPVSLFCFFLFFAFWSPAFAQKISVQTKENTLYDQQKHAYALAHPYQKTVKLLQRTTGKNNFGTALAGATSGCFIPADDSYTSLAPNDDGSTDEIQLPFTFDLYGDEYNSLYVNNNGNVTFGSSLSEYTPDGFPIGVPMVAPFWADVDTRAAGVVSYKVSATNIIVTWTGVGYYDEETDKLNTFQLILTNGQDPIIGVGNNVAFYYADMEWTTGDVSGGTDGLGGSPATVGINKGDGTNYVQVGRFDESGSSYGGPGSVDNGVSYLSGKCFEFNVGAADTTNIPPSVSGLPADNTISLKVGDTVTISPQFIGPEVDQTVTTTLNTGGLCGVTSDITNDTVSTANITIIGSSCNVGTNTITLTAVDNGTPPETTTVNLTVIVSKLDQTITFDPIPDHTYGDPPFAISATASSGLPVTFTVISGPASVSDDEVTITGVGTVTIEADQAGDGDYNAAPPVTQTFTVDKASQTITFDPITSQVYGNPDFDPGATASSGLPVTYTSSNTDVATIVGGLIHIVGAGTSTITASQAGDDDYDPAADVSQLLTVGKADQTISFPPLPVVVVGDPDFDPGATASSGLTVTYTSSNLSVATIVGGLIHIVGQGTSLITASQGGDDDYNAADDVSQTLTVNAAQLNQQITFNAIPSKTYGAADFSPGASANSGLTVTYTSSNTAVATIVSGNIHITGVGSTIITASQPGNAGYFAATPVQQTFTVTKAPLTITAVNQSKTAGTANPALTVTYAGFVYGETSAVLTALPTITTTATVSSQAGSYPITVSGATAANYSITYVQGTLTVNGTTSANANLSNLTLSNGTLSPAFASGTYSYTTSVGANLTTMTVTPTAASATSTIKVNGIAVNSGTASQILPLTTGSNTVTIVVTAQGGAATQTYALIITEAKSANDNLVSLKLSGGSLSPVFASATTSYTATEAVSSITVTPTTADPTATVTVNGAAVTSGTASPSIALVVGSNTVTTIVTAQNGATKTYTVIITRSAPSTVAALSALSLSSGTLSPTFASATTSYTASVSNATTSVTVTPTTASLYATVTVNGNTVASGSPSGGIALSVGANTIITKVTAQDGINTKTYTITVTRAPASNNAALASFTLSNGALSPVFATGTYSYTTSVGANLTTMTVTPTTADPTATVAVNGVPVTSGSASQILPLTVGPNTITTVVTAQDGVTQQTYTLIITEAKSANDNLSLLKVSSGPLSPVFAAATTSYTTTTGASSITVTPTTADPTATVTVNGAAVTSGTASPSIALVAGSNTVTTIVTAQNGATKTYTVIITRSAPSTVAALSALSLSAGTLSPTFASATTSYTASVSNATTSVTVTPTTASLYATVAVNGNTVASGSPSGGIALSVGANTITTKVTAQDGVTTKTYTITVTRAPSSNAALANFALSNGTLSPVFATGTYSYTTSVGANLTTMTITPTTADPTATVAVNGIPVTSGSASQILPLTVGPNTITTVVTAQDGVTQQTYTLIITEAKSGNDNLSLLKVSSGPLSPVFAAATTSYTTTTGASSITVTPTTADPTATVTVNGAAVTSGTASNAVALAVGTNTITTIVTAQNGATKTYTVIITRSAPSTVAALSALSLSAGTLSPTFASATTSYTASVSNATTSVTVTPTTASLYATVTVNGNTVASGSPSGGIALSVGANTITTKVTAQDGVTTKTYTITVTRAPSSNAALANFALSNGTLSPVFATGTYSYTTSVGANLTTMTITPTTADPTATVAVNGVPVTSGSASQILPLTVGPNTITTVVTAQDGVTQQTYTLIITEAKSANDNLSLLKISSGPLSPVFAAATTSYTTTTGASSITVTPTTADPAATVTVNGAAVTSGAASPSIALVVGSNTITTIVTAQSGATKTYTVIITRSAPSTVAALSALTISTGTLSPAFASTTNGYTVNVGYLTSSVTVTPTAASPYATITVNGTAVSSGSASSALPLSVGTNAVIISVTSQDGSNTKNYSIVVNRASPSNNAALANLTLSNGTLSPVFATGTYVYSTGVGANLTAMTVTPTAADPTATITVNGTPVTSGTASPLLSLTTGQNTITTVVTAQDGITKDTYTLIITEAKSSNANLGMLKLSSGALTPVFAAATTSYTQNVTNTVAAITVTPTTADPTATVTINGAPVVSGAASASIALAVGVNTVTAAVTAQNGITKTYTVTVTRAISGDNNVYLPVSVEKQQGDPGLNNDGITVHQGISPNGDGINDFLQIDNISQYPDNKLSIMNRNGQLIYEASGYDNSSKVFDGHSNKNGQMQLPGTYFYQLDYTVNGVTKHQTGFLVLKY